MTRPVRTSELLKKHFLRVIATRIVLRRFVLAWLFLLAGVGNASSGCSSSGSPGLADAGGGDAESPGLADAERGDAAESPGVADAEVADATADAGGGDATADAGGGDATADAGGDAGGADATTTGPIADSQAPVDSGSIERGEVSTTYPAFTAAQLLIPTVKSRGGPVITNPKIVVVTFANDPDADLIDAFNDELVASTYWQTTTTEYGVGPLTVSNKVRMAAPAASLDRPGVEALVTANLGSGAPLGPSDSSTLYALYFPSTTSLSDNAGVSCKSGGFGGYHEEIQGADGGGIQIAYAAIARCPSSNPHVSPLEETFSGATHEYVEWATDPYVGSAPAYSYARPGAWGLDFALGELGDLCVNFAPFQQFLAPLGDSGQQGLFQRTWSNASALALHHPCIPIPTGEAYFNSSPDLGDVLPIGVLAPNGGMYTVLGVKVPIGTSRTLAVRLFSDRDTQGPWDVFIDTPNPAGAGTVKDPRFTYAFDRTSGQNGEILNLTITGLPNTALTDAGTSPVGSVIIWSRSKQQLSYWPFFVAN